MTKYRPLDAKFAGIAMELPPVAFRIHIPVMAASVSGGNPSRTGAWRLFPSARLPVICVSFIVVVSADPDMISAWASRTMLPDTDRGAKLYDDFRMGRNYPKSEAKQSSNQQFSHFLFLAAI